MIQIILIFNLLFFVLTGCSPAQGPSSPLMDPPLAERPDTSSSAIIARDLPYESDERISYCEILSSDKNSYSGYRDQKTYALASLSKVITTAWALKKLGPDFSFESTLYFQPVAQQPGVIDAYLSTGYDPIFNIEKILYLLAQLNERGVRKIRNLVIDETTRVFLSVLSQPHIELNQTPISTNESVANLMLILNSANWSSQTQAARQRLMAWSLDHQKNLKIPTSFSTELVISKKRSSLELTSYSQKISMISAPLLKYLKNLNVYSNNYISDALFLYLGGVQEFQKFQESELKLSSKSLQVLTGSGLADYSSGFRRDNVGSCVAMLKVLNYVDIKAQQQGLNVGHILYNPGYDQDGTFESEFNFANQVVIKTGRLFENPAFNLAGIVSTTKGSLYFSFLGHHFDSHEATEMEIARNQMLQSVLDFYPTQSHFLTLKEFQIFLK